MGRSKPLAALMLSVITGGVVHGQCASPPGDMVSWWDADTIAGTRVRDVLARHDGNLLNGTTSTPSGLVGDALAFDGINDYVRIPGAVLANGNFTVEAWLNIDPAAPAAGQGIVAQEGSGGNHTGQFSFNILADRRLNFFRRYPARFGEIKMSYSAHNDSFPTYLLVWRL